MRVAQRNIDVNEYGSRCGTAFVEQRKRVHEHSIVTLPKWRHPTFGYLAILPLLMMMVSMWLMQTGLVLPGTFLSLTLVLMAFLWGARSAIVMLILAIGCLDYFIAPGGHWLPANWQDALSLLLSGMIGLLLIWITVQRERARMKALVAERALLAYVDELEEMNQMKDRFISIASHELKTPVTTIRVQTQFMLRRLSKQKDTGLDKEFLLRSMQRMDEQTERLTTLIIDLLDINRIGAGKAVLKRQLYDLNEICRKVIEDQCLLTERQIILDMPALPVEVDVDSDRLTQVMINLIGNAVKYSPQDSRVEVSIRLDTKHALVQIHDYGRGIAKDDQPRIFDTFYRTRDAQVSGANGFGLGLAIAKEIVELHEGRIWCESELGTGSTFLVELPLHNKQ